MFRNVSPESVGIESRYVKEFIEHLEDLGVSVHDVLLMRGETVFCEAYWKPFHKNFLHRQYSQTKSFVGVAIGLLEEEGKLKLTDKIADYFRDKIDGELPTFLAEQTILDTLTMRTSIRECSWFTSEQRDRCRLYFSRPAVRPSGSTWKYDSSGSQVLSCLVERLAGMSLLDYLREKLFNKMGVFKDAYVLKTPTGESWGDSALVCLPQDMLAFGRFVMNYGVWKGERLMNEAYLKTATSAVVANAELGHMNAHNCGYGYQIWRVEDNAFGFFGMGQQLTICYPDYDMIFVINSDSQAAYYPYDVTLKYVKNDILKHLKSKALPESKEENDELNEYLSTLELRTLKGFESSPIKEQINGKRFIAVGENPQGIKSFAFHFEKDNFGRFCYENAQGQKEIAFGINKNAFGKFPQFGYSNEVGGVKSTDGYLYDCACSLAFKGDNQMMMFVQVIDKYFGNISIELGFKKGYMTVKMTKRAEDFLQEYEGEFIAKIED